MPWGWILIIGMQPAGFGNLNAITSAGPFETQQVCMIAGEQVKKDITDNIKFTCVYQYKNKD